MYRQAKVLVTVVQGDNLSNSGKSPDSYVECKIGTNFKNSRVISKNTNPAWNELMPIEATPTSVLECSVYDKGFISNTCIGYAAINLQDGAMWVPTGVWHALGTNPKLRNKAQGGILVKLAWEQMAQQVPMGQPVMGYAAPPPGGAQFMPPPSGGGFVSQQPPQGGYGQPPMQGPGYVSQMPPPQGGYGQPPMQGPGYVSQMPPPQGGYGQPPMQGPPPGFGHPPPGGEHSSMGPPPPGYMHPPPNAGPQ